jgi:ddrB-like ParB superfamily domain
VGSSASPITGLPPDAIPVGGGPPSPPGNIIREAIPGATPGQENVVSTELPADAKIVEDPNAELLYRTPEGVPVYAKPRPPGAPILQTAAQPSKQPPDQWFTNPALDFGAHQAVSGYSGALAGVDHLAAVTSGLMDVAAQKIADLTGTEKGGVFEHISNWAQDRQRKFEQQAAETRGTDTSLPGAIIRSAAGAATSFPVYAAAGTLGGAVKGFALLSALENADQGWKAALMGAGEGALMGKFYQTIDPLGRAIKVPLASIANYFTLRAQGADPETAASNALTAGGMAGLTPGTKTAEQVARGLRPGFESNLPPVQQQAIDYLRSEGVPLTAGQQTGSKFLRGTEASVGHMPIGAQYAEEFGTGQAEAIKGLSGRLAEQAYPTPVAPYEAGQEASLALNKEISDLNEQEQAAYERAWQEKDNSQFAENVPVAMERKPMLDAAGKPTGTMQNVPVMEKVQMPVDVRWMKNIARQELPKLEYLPAAEQAQSAAFSIYKKILSGPDHITAEQAEEALKGLKGEARKAPSPELRNYSQGAAAALIPRLQAGVDQAVAKTGQEAVDALRNGRNLHYQKTQIADVADDLRKEPVQAFGQMTMAKDAGYDFLAKIASKAPDIMPRLGRAWLDNVFDLASREGDWRKAQTILNKYYDLGNKTKALMFPEPSLRQALERFFLGQKMTGIQLNPSGTALVTATQKAMANPLGWVQGWLGGKALYTPRGIRLLLKATENPPTTPAAAAALKSEARKVLGPPEEPPEGPPTGGVPSPPSPPLSPSGSAAAPPEATLLEGATNAADDDTGGPQNRKGAEVPPSSETGASQSSRATSIPVPGSARSYQGHYAVKELSDIQPSHSGLSFAPNEKYQIVNDRDYRRPENQFKILHGSTGPNFDPRYLITDNPDAGNGPPVVDSQGNVLGGNGRGMILQRVYANNPAGAQAYKNLLAEKAGNFGLDAAEVRAMKQPVLVREVPDTELAGAQSKQGAVTDFNVKGTAELRPSEKALADSRRVSPQTLDDIGTRLDVKGPDATLLEALEGKSGAEVLQNLIADGAIAPQEAAAYVSDGKLTPAGKTRISQAMLGRFFNDPAQMDRLAPSIRNKLEQIAAPLVRVENQQGWSLTPHVLSALDLLEDAAAHKSANLDDYLEQAGLFGNQTYSPESVTLAKAMRSMTPTELKKAARAYAQDARFASEGTGLFGEPPTPAEAFAAAFGSHAAK